MKIKLHNSMGRTKSGNQFIFDDKVFIFSDFFDIFWLRNRIDDEYPFVYYSNNTKDFSTAFGFGSTEKLMNTEIVLGGNWKLIGDKENENQTT